MDKIKELKDIYSYVKEKFNSLPLNNSHMESKLLELIEKLSFDTKLTIFEDEKYNPNEVSKLFRFYEEQLKDSYDSNEELFEVKFKCYLLLIKLFTELCTTFATNMEKRVYINEFFQLLIESKNLLKFTLPLDSEHVTILNNLIGEHLYYFSHIHYISIQNKEMDYILEEYLMNCEKMLHGYELSLASNFGNKEFTTKDIEYAIFINNTTFLLLKMIYKLKHFKGDSDFFKMKEFNNILEFFYKISLLQKDTCINTKQEFESAILTEFVNSANYLQKHKNHDMYKEKIQLLKLNTDEYKQLIDIIITSKSN